MEMILDIFVIYFPYSVNMFRSFPGFAIETSSGIITYPVSHTQYCLCCTASIYNIQVPGKIEV